MMKMNLIQLSKYGMRMMGVLLFMALGFMSFGQSQLNGSTTISKQEIMVVEQSNLPNAINASTILLNQVNSINANSIEGGVGEMEQSLTVEFYYDIMTRLKKGSATDDAILKSYPGLVSRASKFATTINTEAILQSTVDLLN